MKQNLTITLDRQIVLKVKILAARRETSISGLVAAQLEALVAEDDAYTAAKDSAFSLLDVGFRLGGRGMANRDDLHAR